MNDDVRDVIRRARTVNAAEIIARGGIPSIEPDSDAILAALAEAGYVVVKLPDPSYVDEPELDVRGYGFNGDANDKHLAAERGVYAHGGVVYDQWDGVSADDARKIGSWWLAAAEKAVE